MIIINQYYETLIIAESRLILSKKRINNQSDNKRNLYQGFL